MKKRWLAVLLVLGMVFAGASPALGTEETAVAVTFQGYELEVEALAREGVTLVAVEPFLAALGGPAGLGSWGQEPLEGALLYRWAEDGRQTLTAQWYDKSISLTAGLDGAQLRGGTLWAPLRPLAEGLGLTVEWTDKVELTRPKERIEVDSLKALFLALGPDREIVLKRGEYSFADLDPKELEGVNSPYFYVDYGLFDTQAGDWGLGTVYQVVIQNLRDVHILLPGCRIATPWAYADVWHFEDCRRVTVEGGTAVHDVEPGYCMGNCVYLEDCQDMALDSVVLDGSGIWGLNAVDCRSLLLKNAHITRCTWGAVALTGCEGVTVDASRIYENTTDFPLFSFHTSGGVRVSRSVIEDNAAPALGSYIDSRGVVFDDCTFGLNDFGRLSDFGGQGSGGAVFADCALHAGAFPAFLEARGLTGLIPEGLAMTQENKDGVVWYFARLPEPERTYVTQLLGQIAAGQATAADGCCDRASGVYLTDCRYCLYDLDGDERPEFILETGGDEAGRRYTVYTMADGALVDCGGFPGGHAALYADGQGGLLGYMGQMGVYELTAYALEGTQLAETAVASGTLDFSKGEDYPDLGGLGYEDVQTLEFSPLPALFLAPKG